MAVKYINNGEPTPNSPKVFIPLVLDNVQGRGKNNSKVDDDGGIDVP